jgi:hypothetical protein
MRIDARKRGSEGLLESKKEVNECLKEEMRHVKKVGAMRRRAKRVFLVVLALLTIVFHYLSFSSPGWVVVNGNGEIHGLTNKARAVLQGKRFWKDQLDEVYKEIQQEESGLLRNSATERVLDYPDRNADRRMERLFRRYPQFRSSMGELYTEAMGGRVNQIKWMQINSLLEETRRKRSQELKETLPVVQSKAG